MRNVIVGGLVVAVAAASGTSCATPKGKGDNTESASSTTGGATSTDSGESGGEIPWIEDDYAAALAKARETERPLVIDMWAPWCHTCVAMQNHVLENRALEPLADRFVWLRLETDLDKNAKILERLPVSVWPTFYVLGADESIQARHAGAASVKQFREFLLLGEKAHLATLAEDGALEEGSPLAHTRRGDRAATDRDFGTAAEAYAAALEAAPADWGRRPDVLASRLGSLLAAQQLKQCAEVTRANMDETGGSASATSFAQYALMCARNQPNDDVRRELSQLITARMKGLLEGEHTLSYDDQSEAIRIWREALEELEAFDRARKLARRHQKLLDEAAEQAPTAHAEMAYSAHRSWIYVYLEEGDKILPWLERLAEELPEQYDPRHRLAWVHMQQEDYGKAEKWAKEGVELAYGQRKATVYAILAKIQMKAGKPGAARKTMENLLAHVESLPEGHAMPEVEKQTRAKLAEFGK